MEYKLVYRQDAVDLGYPVPDFEGQRDNYYILYKFNQWSRDPEILGIDGGSLLGPYPRDTVVDELNKLAEENQDLEARMEDLYGENKTLCREVENLQNEIYELAP